MVPSSVLAQLKDPRPVFQERVESWLPFAWPVQLGSDGMVWGAEDAADIDWAFVLVQLRLPHPPVPRVELTDPVGDSELDLTARILCWALNRVVQGGVIDQQLPEYGYQAADSQAVTLNALLRLADRIPDYAQALVMLELLYRGIGPTDQARILPVCGQDVTRAAHQMNTMCINPQDPDRTLLQVKHIALKFCGHQEAALATKLRVQLSDGRKV